MIETMASFIRALEKNDLRYQHEEATEKHAEYVRVGFTGKHGQTFSFIFFFEEKYMNVKCFSICKVPTEKLMDFYVKINEINKQYRWVKFYLDGDNELTLACDAILSEETAGEETLEIMRRCLNIMNEVYPEFMKALWS